MNIFDQLRRDEGSTCVTYLDSLGNPTIGVGHKLHPWEHFPEGITSEQRDQFLRDDVLSVQDAIRRHLPWVLALDDARCGAVENMTFNMGIYKLLQFEHMLAALQEHDWERTVAEMANSLWAKQVGNRAKRLQAQMLTGEWQ